MGSEFGISVGTALRIYLKYGCLTSRKFLICEPLEILRKILCIRAYIFFFSEDSIDYVRLSYGSMFSSQTPIKICPQSWRDSYWVGWSKGEEVDGFLSF